MCSVSLKVNFPIVATQLGVFDSNSDGLRGSLTARLYDRISQVSELSVTLLLVDWYSNFIIGLLEKQCGSNGKFIFITK